MPIPKFLDSEGDLTAKFLLFSKIVPLSGSKIPYKIFTNVLLPAPFSPKIA